MAISGRHRVVVAVVAHEREGGHARRPAITRIIGRRRQRLQRVQIALEALADALGVSPQPVIQPGQAALFEMGVQRRKARDLRERHQVVAPGITDQALNLALVVALARPAKAVEEQVVRLQLGKAARALASAIGRNTRRGYNLSKAVWIRPAAFDRYLSTVAFSILHCRTR